MNDGENLREQAESFAGRLTHTIRAVFPHAGPFHAKSLENGSRFVVQQEERHGIPLSVDRTPILSLKVHFDCRLDGRERYLAVDESSIIVYAGAKASGEPLFRYEYIRQPQGHAPAAHIHIHAHRDAFTAAMVRAGEATKRGRRRANNTGVPRMSELHFPVGGHRFRPSIEDILEMLIDEFGINSPDDFRSELRKGRVTWRQIQTKAVVRDNPEAAIQALNALGYDVRLRADVPKPTMRMDRLEEL